MKQLGYRLLAIGFLLLFAQSLRSESAVALEPETFIRVEKDREGTIARQLGMRELIPESDDQATIALVGVAHFGTSNYYATIQKELDTFDLVLFEGVGFDEAERLKKERIIEDGVTA